MKLNYSLYIYDDAVNKINVYIYISNECMLGSKTNKAMLTTNISTERNTLA